MSGYADDFSKSNNALEAEANGRYPASKTAALLGVPIEFVRACRASEWHHSSKHYNCVDYFDLETVREILESPEGQEELATVKSEKKLKQTQPVKTLTGCSVKWLEWSGSRKHPRATECIAEGCAIEDAGGKFVLVKFTDGKILRKGRDTRGFEVSQNGKRIWL